MSPVVIVCRPKIGSHIEVDVAQSASGRKLLNGSPVPGHCLAEPVLVQKVAIDRRFDNDELHAGPRSQLAENLTQIGEACFNVFVPHAVESRIHLVIVRGAPWENIADARNVVAVIQDGYVVVDRR